MSRFLVLIVEDDKNLREAIKETLSFANMDCITAADGKEALLILNSTSVNLVLSDVQMPELDGITLLKSIKNKYSYMPVILMTAYSDVQNAVEAIRLGASDYLIKPFETKTLVNLIQQFAANSQPNQPIAASVNSITLLETARHVASSDTTVMITGESGTGKEILARYIHENSSRKENAFIAINCAAIPENMLESVLFGYEKGAFTGAYQATPGKFELSHNGTILLDEISEMDLNLQAKLLRVLQEKEVDRLGAKKSIPVDVRVIATSNRDLLKEVKENRFREDLYYRLNVIPLSWPALRERKDDILPISEFMLRKHASKMQIKIPALSEAAKLALIEYSWPGNVRELENVIQRALVFHKNGCIEKQDFCFTENSLESSEMLKLAVATAESLKSDVKKQEYKLIIQALTEYKGNRKLIAEKLGISPRTLRYKLAKMRDEGLPI
jgi:two-component system response regulator FlrC